MMNKISAFLGATKPFRVVVLCVAMVAAGFALGVAATRPGIAQAESGSLKVMQALGARMASQALTRRENLAIVLQTTKGHPEAVTALHALLEVGTGREFGRDVAVGSYEASLGFMKARHPYLNFMPMPTGSDMAEARRAELDADLFAKTGMRLPDAATN